MYIWVSGSISPRILNLGNRWRWVVNQLDQFTPGERASSTHWIGGSVDGRADLDITEKKLMSSPAGNGTAIPRSSNPDPNHSTAWANFKYEFVERSNFKE
jgi:hypothetical protein